MAGFQANRVPFSQTCAPSLLDLIASLSSEPSQAIPPVSVVQTDAHGGCLARAPML